MKHSHPDHSKPEEHDTCASGSKVLARSGRWIPAARRISRVALALVLALSTGYLGTACSGAGRIGPKSGSSNPRPSHSANPTPSADSREVDPAPQDGQDPIISTGSGNDPTAQDGQDAVETKPADGVVSFNVREFGAVGDGSQNDYEAFRKALTHLRSLQLTKPRELFIPDGAYYLLPPDDATAHISIQDEQALTIRGGASTKLLLGSAFHYGVMVANSRNVQLESLTVDYKQLPFTQGTITEVDGATRRFVLELDPGYPRVDAAQLQADGTLRIAYLFKPGSTILLTETHDQYIDATEPLDDRHWRLTTQQPVTQAYLGLRAALVGRRSIDAVVFYRSSDSSARQVVVHSAPGLGFSLRHTSRITIDHCKVIQAPGTGRLLSTNADGIHVKWGKVGPQIRYCHLEGMGDDGINIGGTYQQILEQPDKRTLIVEQHASLGLGKAMVLVYNETGAMKLLPEVTKLEDAGAQRARLSFAENLPTIEHLATNSADGMADMVINFNEVAAGAVVTNNYIGRNRMRGIILHAPSALIELNRFEDMLGPAIRVGHHYRGSIEGPNGSNSIIRNNTFVNIQDSPVHVSDNLDDSDVTQRSIEGLEISGNRFLGYGKPSVRKSGVTGCVVYLDNAHRVQLRSNLIGDPDPDAPAIRRVLLNDVADVAISAADVSPNALVDNEWLGVDKMADMSSVTMDP